MITRSLKYVILIKLHGGGAVSLLAAQHMYQVRIHSSWWAHKSLFLVLPTHHNLTGPDSALNLVKLAQCTLTCDIFQICREQ